MVTPVGLYSPPLFKQAVDLRKLCKYTENFKMQISELMKSFLYAKVLYTSYTPKAYVFFFKNLILPN